MKIVTIFFDLERCHYNYSRKGILEDTVKAITKILDRYNVSAVFNTCGVVAEERPDLIKALHDKGHEIASHGYAHENLIQAAQVGELKNILTRAETAIKNATGNIPIGLRAPWLFHDARVYSILKKREYKWASNRNTLMTEVLNAPNTSFKPIKKVFFGLLWNAYKKEPFRNNGLLEIPLLSSQDGELLSLVHPGQKSPEARLDFAFNALKSQFDKSGKWFNLNFHPWLIGSMNRSALLERIIEHISRHDVKFMLPREMVVGR